MRGDRYRVVVAQGYSKPRGAVVALLAEDGAGGRPRGKHSTDSWRERNASMAATFTTAGGREAYSIVTFI